MYMHLNRRTSIHKQPIPQPPPPKKNTNHPNNSSNPTSPAALLHVGWRLMRNGHLAPQALGYLTRAYQVLFCFMFIYIYILNVRACM